MEIKGRIVRHISLISISVLIAPMILFPDRLGTGLVSISPINAIYELIYYGVVISFFFRRAPLLKIVQTACLCLVYRLTLGVLFGLLVALMYSMNLTVSLTLGLAEYWPAVLLHIGVTPFILKPIVVQLIQFTKYHHRPVAQPEPDEAPQYDRTASVVSTEMSISKPIPLRVPNKPVAHISRESRVGSLSSPEPAEVNGFTRAMRYIGEDSSVQLAMVVDHEGLLLGQFSRGKLEADDWAPFSLLLCGANRDALRRTGWKSPERVDLLVKDTRIIVAREESWYLMVVAQRYADNFLNIRINQGLDIIRKYIARRYGQKPSLNVEKVYVPST